MPANWSRYGRSAGYIRNQEMADYVGPSGMLVAVWDGQSRGTQHMIDIARRTGMQVRVVLHDPIVAE